MCVVNTDLRAVSQSAPPRNECKNGKKRNRYNSPSCRATPTDATCTILSIVRVPLQRNQFHDRGTYRFQCFHWELVVRFNKSTGTRLSAVRGASLSTGRARDRGWPSYFSSSSRRCCEGLTRSIGGHFAWRLSRGECRCHARHTRTRSMLAARQAALNT